MRKHLEKTVDEDFIERVTKDLAQPITIRPLKGGEFEVLWGDRRWYAFLVKKLPIPCRTLNLDGKEALWIDYGENTDHLDVEADEETEHIFRLIDAELQGEDS
jgi:ParB-like chromosome segregation protein Spo0J